LRVATGREGTASSRYCAQTLEGVAMGHSSTVWALAYSPDGKYLASVSEDCTFKVWICGEKGGEPLYKLTATCTGEHDRAVYHVAWGANGIIATACGAVFID
jgi:cytosolic iron-sulfur protein assembly protein CIAO1